MSTRSPSSRISDAAEQLATVRYLTEAVFMAAESSSVTGEATNALQSLCDVIDKKIKAIESDLEGIQRDMK